MDLSFTDEQRDIQRVFHELARREVRPRAAALDAEAAFPRELFARVGQLGFFGMRYGARDGGGDADGAPAADVLSYMLAVEELAWGSLSLAAACVMQSLMGTYFIDKLAPPALHAELWPRAMSGERVCTICMTEPDAGSDLGAIATRAVERDGRWLVSGRKTWITSAPVADFFTVFARTGEDERGRGQLSIFLVERGAAGLEVGRAIDKMGVRASLTSEVSFDETPVVCLLGEAGAGMTYLREVLAEARLVTAALALGVGRAAFEDANAYASTRQQFGRPIRKFQLVQAHLADMAVDLAAARQLTHWAAWHCDSAAADHGERAQRAAMAKLFASEAAARVCDRAARVMASYGFATDFAVERYLRDVRFTLIGGGTSEILRVNIARGLEPRGER